MVSSRSRCTKATAQTFQAIKIAALSSPSLSTTVNAGVQLRDVVETGPDLEIHGVVRWRRIDLQKIICERFGVPYSERVISALLARLSFSRITGRPQHPGQDPQVIEAFKKTSDAHSKLT
jgi:transposase